MTLIAWQATVQDDEGNVIVNPSITVRRASDDELADIFDGEGAALDNPYTGTSEGFVQFFAQPGKYTIQGARGGSVTQTWTVDLSSPTGKQYPTRAEFVADVAAGYAPAEGTVATADGLSYARSAGASVLPGLPGWLSFGRVYVDHFGAVGDYSSDTDTGTDDLPAIQAGIDYLHDRRGGVLHYRRDHLVNGTIVLKEGVTIKGQGSMGANRQVGAPSWPDSWPLAPGIIGSHTAGPVVLFGESDCVLEDCYIGATEARYNAAVTTGDQNTNCGVLMEGIAGGAPVTRPICRSVLVRNQPADGFAIVNKMTSVLLDQCVAVNCERHSYLVNSGTLTGSSAPDMPGIIRILGCRGVNSGGHGVCIGDTGVGPFAYRVQIENIECFRAARNAEHTYISAQHFLRGQDIVVRSSAGGGTSGFSGAEPTLDYSYAISGWNIRLEANRYIRYTTAAVNLFSMAGFANRGIIIEGATPSTAADNPDYFLDITAGGVDGLFVKGVRGDFNVSTINPAQLGSNHRNVIVDQGNMLGELRWNVPVDSMVSDSFSSRGFIIGDDAVEEIEFEGTSCYGVAEFTSASGASGAYGRVRFRVGDFSYCRLVDSDGATVNTGTAELSGTTGADGAFNVAATSGNKLQFENRLGSSQNIVITLTTVNTSSGRPVRA